MLSSSSAIMHLLYVSHVNFYPSKLCHSEDMLESVLHTHTVLKTGHTVLSSGTVTDRLTNIFICCASSMSAVLLLGLIAKVYLFYLSLPFITLSRVHLLTALCLLLFIFMRIFFRLVKIVPVNFDPWQFCVLASTDSPNCRTAMLLSANLVCIRG